MLFDSNFVSTAFSIRKGIAPFESNNFGHFS